MVSGELGVVGWEWIAVARGVSQSQILNHKSEIPPPCPAPLDSALFSRFAGMDGVA